MLLEDRENLRGQLAKADPILRELFTRNGGNAVPVSAIIDRGLELGYEWVGEVSPGKDPYVQAIRSLNTQLGRHAVNSTHNSTHKNRNLFYHHESERAWSPAAAVADSLRVETVALTDQSAPLTVPTFARPTTEDSVFHEGEVVERIVKVRKRSDSARRAAVYRNLDAHNGVSTCDVCFKTPFDYTNDQTVARSWVFEVHHINSIAGRVSDGSYTAAFQQCSTCPVCHEVIERIKKAHGDNWTPDSVRLYINEAHVKAR